MNQQATPQPDLSAADRCVKCGLCLPHCPTFRLTGNEADSPRGRISLMQMIAEPEPVWSPGLFRHLDRCLQCRACEAMCPSKVPYGALMDTARAMLEPRRPDSALHRRLQHAGLALAASPHKLRILKRLLGLYRGLGLQRLVGHLPAIPAAVRRANALLPSSSSRDTQAPATGGEAGTVSLFRGCAGSLFDQRTLDATRNILQRLGWRVEIPDTQTCCGALHLHSGDAQTAARLMATNRKAFDTGHPVIGTSSACTGQLAEQGLGAQAVDILHFLLQQDLSALQFEPLPEKVAVYVPCTHRNVLKQGQDLEASLRTIPGVEPVTINPQGGCCGAAGSYMLTEPEFADRLRTEVLDTVAASGVRHLVTSNIGCALHLQAGLRQRGMDVEVVHPVVLLAQQLRPTQTPP